jgi:D-inositol-3-phosphate glycosyltransferase
LIDLYRVNADRVHVIHCGISPFYQPCGNDSSTDRLVAPGTRVLLHVGAIIARKNILFLVDVLSKVLRQSPDVKLVLIGEEFSPQKEYTAKVFEAIRKQGVEKNVLLLGKVSEHEKLAWYNRCDVFVFPSLKEGFGFAPAEAMACAKPVVCSNTWSLPEIVVDGVTGWTCSPTSADEFSSKILEILASSDLQSKFGQAGAERIRSSFRWETAATQTLDLYRSLTSGEGRRVK